MKTKEHLHCRCMNQGGRCSNNHYADCKICHTIPATASVEGWETEFDLKYPRVVGHRFVEGRDGVKTFIRTQIARAREEGAAEMKCKADELADALLSMYSQYCDNGHVFMSAGEFASSVLEQQGYATFDEAGRLIKVLSLPTQE